MPQCNNRLNSFKGFVKAVAGAAWQDAVRRAGEENRFDGQHQRNEYSFMEDVSTAHGLLVKNHNQSGICSFFKPILVDLK